MPPKHPTLDSADGGPTNPVAGSEPALAFGAGADGSDIGFGQFGHAVQDTVAMKTHCNGASSVFLTSEVFQVGGAVVRLVPVDVVDIVAVRTGASKRLKGDRVKPDGFFDALPIEGRIQIPLPSRPGLQDSQRTGVTDTPVSADFVQPLEFDDIAPLFGRGTIWAHRTLQRSGVMPPASNDRAGVLARLKYTTFRADWCTKRRDE